MPVAVDAVDARPVALVLEAVELLHVASAGRNETALAGKALRLIQDAALLGIADRDLAGATTFAPTGLEEQGVAAIRPRPAGS